MTLLYKIDIMANMKNQGKIRSWCLEKFGWENRGVIFDIDFRIHDCICWSFRDKDDAVLFELTWG